MSEEQKASVKELMQELLNKCYQLVRSDSMWQVQDMDGKTVMESKDYGICFKYIKDWEDKKCEFLGKWF